MRRQLFLYTVLITLAGGLNFNLVMADAELAAKVFKENKNSIVKVTPVGQKDTGGTGFAVKPENSNPLIVTNAHVCLHTQNEFGLLHVHTQLSKNPETRKVLLINKKEDLCLIDGLASLPPVKLGLGVRLGEVLVVLGHPALEPVQPSNSGIALSYEFIEMMERIEDEKAPCDGVKKEVDFKTFLNHSKTKLYTTSQPSPNPSGWLNPFPTVSVCSTTRESIMASVESFPGNSGSPVFNKDNEVVAVDYCGSNRTNKACVLEVTHLNILIRAYLNK